DLSTAHLRTAFYSLSLHDALPICGTVGMVQVFPNSRNVIPGEVKFSIDLRNVNDELLNTMHEEMLAFIDKTRVETGLKISIERVDRKSTRLNSSHSQISYAVFCLK